VLRLAASRSGGLPRRAGRQERARSERRRRRRALGRALPGWGRENAVYTSYPFSGDGTLNELKVYKEKDLLLMPYDKGVEGQLVRQCGFVK